MVGIPFFILRFFATVAHMANSYITSSSNLLYPKEDKMNHKLMFTCRTCHVGEPANSHCVFQNNLNSQVGDTAGVTTDVGSDPTVGAPLFCTRCGDEIHCSVCERVMFCSEEEFLKSLGVDESDVVDTDDEDDFEETPEETSENTKSS